jgi:putative intracellular protease/amidase
MSRKILIVLSEWGFWGEELIGPLETFDAAGYQSVFATPTGKRPVAIGVSKDHTFIDPPLGKPVTTEEMAEKVQKIDDPSNLRLDNPINLSAWFPMQPYWSAPEVLRKWEAYYRDVAKAQEQLQQYDALLVVGGSGPLVDLANNHRVHDLIFGFLRYGKPVAVECYAVTCLAFARNMDNRKSIIWGKHVTGHCKEYDYLDNTMFMKGYDQVLDFNMGAAPFPLEYILRDATGPEGGYHGNVGRETSVIVDYPFITGRSTPDAYFTGQMLVEVLERGLRRYGW